MYGLIRNIGVVLFVYFIIFSLFFSCTNSATRASYQSHLKEMKQLYQNADNSPIPNENFVFVKKYLHGTEEAPCKSTDNILDCPDRHLLTTASGVVVDRKRDVVKILTAAHWCEEEKGMFMLYGHGPDEVPMTSLEADFFGQSLEAEIIAQSEYSDLCLISVKSDYAHMAKKVKVAKKEPKLGEKLYVISAPLSMGDDNVRLHFEGKYGGCYEDWIWPFCFYTIPATGGSSGSGGFNERGELVGIITISMTGFEEISGGANIDLIREFLDIYL